jgi:hypothetical protein
MLIAMKSAHQQVEGGAGDGAAGFQPVGREGGGVRQILVQFGHLSGIIGDGVGASAGFDP